MHLHIKGKRTQDDSSICFNSFQSDPEFCNEIRTLRHGAQLKQKDAAISALQQDLQSANDKLEKVEQKSKSLWQINKGLNLRWLEALSKQKDAEDSLAPFQRKINALQSWKAGFESQSANSVHDKAKTEVRCSQLGEQVKSLEDKLEEARNNNQSLEKGHSSTMKLLEQRNQKMMVRVEHLEAEMKKTELENKELKKRSWKVNELEEELKSVEVEVTELRKIRPGVEELETELKNAMMQGEELWNNQQKVRELELRMESAGLESENLHNAQQTIHELQIKLEKATTLKNEEIQQSQQRSKQLEVNLRNARLENGELKKGWDTAKVFVNSLTEDVKELEKDITLLTEDVKILEKESTQLRDVARVIKDYATPREQVKCMKKEEIQPTNNTGELGINNPRVTKETENLQEDNSLLKKTVEKLEESNTLQKTTTEKMKEELVEMSDGFLKQYNLDQMKISEYERNISRIRNERNHLRIQIDTFKTQEGDLARVRNERDYLREQVKSFQRQAKGEQERLLQLAQKVEHLKRGEAAGMQIHVGNIQEGNKYPELMRQNSSNVETEHRILHSGSKKRNIDEVSLGW